jgi:hypothetical protein
MVLDPWTEVRVMNRLVVQDVLPVEKDIAFSFGNLAGTSWLPTTVAVSTHT